MIYTGSKALAYLTIPVYTIFKNLTIICIAYGEVLCFGGSVTRMALMSFGLMVLSSGVAAWADVKTPAQPTGTASDGGLLSMFNPGYVWMAFNCVCNAVFVLAMKVRIKVTNFKDFDSRSHRRENESTFADHVDSHVLQQSFEYSHSSGVFAAVRGLVFGQRCSEFPS